MVRAVRWDVHDLAVAGSRTGRVIVENERQLPVVEDVVLLRNVTRQDEDRLEVCAHLDPRFEKIVVVDDLLGDLVSTALRHVVAAGAQTA